MTPLRIFVSSVQKELADERATLSEYLRRDALLGRFFEAFLFEEMPAADHRADSCYLDEVRHCDIYLGIFGNEYGREDPEGLSPTHREFKLATELGKIRLIYVKGSDDSQRHPKMKALIDEAGTELIRRRINSAVELNTEVYASLVKLLEERELIRLTPFDATFCRNATVDDLDFDGISRFLVQARRGRSFPLPEESPPLDVLTHLNLLDKGRPTHAAILLFGKQPQRFLITSEVKCAHFHGYEVFKPIPSYQVYKGTLFDLVDQAIDFVLSKIDLWVGTRAEGSQAPTAYEIPREVVAEAIVNAVCHRDYTSNASVQVMLFKDRLEVWNPANVPPTLTLESLRGPHASVPPNPLIAEPMYLTKYIERMGTGIRDMIVRCREAGLPEPEIRLDAGSWVTTIRRKPAPVEVTLQITPQVTPQVTPQATPQVEKLLGVLQGEMSREQIMDALVLRDRKYVIKDYLQPAVEAGFIEMTLPEKPSSPLQKYRLTAKGLAILKKKPER